MDGAGDERDDRHHPKIDVSAALGDAGHEVADQGFEGLADTGPVEETAETREAEETLKNARDLALERGRFGLPALPTE